jgi:pilus assembly protein CpaE
MVTGLDVPGVRGMRTELDILNSLGLLIGRRRVLVNMVDPAVGMTIRDVEATLGVPVDVAVPRSKEVALSTNTGIPLVQKRSRGPFIKALARLAGEFDPNRPQQDRKGTHRRAEVIR